MKIPIFLYKSTQTKVYMKKELDSVLRKFLGVENIVYSGRAALGIYAALRVWGIHGTVAVSSAVCQDVVAAILMAGWKPFFCDIDPETGNTKSSEWLRASKSGVNAAIVVHLFGNAANTLHARNAFPNGLVIDDAAQALGARLSKNSNLAGTDGDIGLISFGKSKQIEVGGAALLFKDEKFAKNCIEVLNSIVPASKDEIITAEFSFRQNLQRAREKLISHNDNSGFHRILNDDYYSALRVSWKQEWCEKIILNLSAYDDKLNKRREKVNLWLESIDGTGLVPIGMDEYSAPWRFACRLSGCNWQRQHTLGEAMRAKDLNVSHWYLPCHWQISSTELSLPGAEILSKEVFQFWLDESIDNNEIINSKRTINKIFNQTERSVYGS